MYKDTNSIVVQLVHATEMSGKTNNDAPFVMEPHPFDKTETESENSNNEDNIEPDNEVCVIHTTKL